MFLINESKESLTMQRWWFMDKKKIIEDAKPTSDRNTTVSVSVESIPDRRWDFNVIVNHELDPREIVAVTGSCGTLGNWNSSQALPLSQNKDKTWSCCCFLPFDGPIYYRYIICAVEPINFFVFVRYWETHLETREITTNCDQVESCDTFGCINGVQKIDRGWLTTETIYQFKLFNNPFTLKQKLQDRKIYIKITPMNLRIDLHCYYQRPSAQPDDAFSNDTRESIIDQPSYSFIEVAKFINNGSKFQLQKQFGELYNTDDYMLFNVSVIDPENTVFLIDLYVFSTRRTKDEPPYHLGYHYLLPNMLTKCDGKLELIITCGTKHRPIGMMKLEYLKITPLEWESFNTKISYVRHRNEKWTDSNNENCSSGTTLEEKNSEYIHENTIASYKKAVTNGADIIDVDIQLTRDMIPVIYHDFDVYVSLKQKKNFKCYDMLELPLNKLNLDQLKNFKVYHLIEGKSIEPRLLNEDLEEHQPFPTLSELFDCIDSYVGFNIEIKWSMELKDGSMEHKFQLIDKNLYVDCILKVVLEKAYDRRVFFSSFDPDICTMIRFKQNLYPVLFLSFGITKKLQNYYDPRCNTIALGIEFATTMELLGVVAHTDDLLRDPSHVQIASDQGLIMFCWGDDNKTQEAITFLKDLGIPAIMYDKRNVFSTANVKESVYLVDSDEAPKFEMFQHQELQPLKEIGGDNCTCTHRILDIQDAKEQIALSTATSLESIVSIDENV